MKISEYIARTAALADDVYFIIGQGSATTRVFWSNMCSSLASWLGFDTATKRFAKTALPTNTVYSDTPLGVAQLPWDDATFQSKLADLALTRDWLAAVTTTLAGTEPTRYQDPNATSSLASLRANGYYPQDNPSRPYFAYGLWLSALEARMMLIDRWHPYTGGLQMRSRVNIPVGVKSTDTNLSLAYCVVNNYLPQAVNLGEKGWATSVAPLSLYRAFDNAANLTAIVGEIDMRYLPDAKSAQFMFRSCPNLGKFLLVNIPDTVTTLDLTGVADAWTVGFKRTVSADQTVAAITESSLMHLCRNITRDISRTKLLQIHVRSAHYSDCQTAKNYVINEFRTNATDTSYTLAQRAKFTECADTLSALVEFVDSGSGEITPTSLL